MKRPLQKTPVKSAIKSFAKQHQLLFSDKPPEAHDTIKGVLNSLLHKDILWVRGAALGHDVAIVLREISAKPDSLKWLILEIRVDADTPYCYVDGHLHDDEIYHKTFSAHTHLRNLSSYLNTFSSDLVVYGEMSHNIAITNFFSEELLATIAHNNDSFDFEFDSNKVRVIKLVEPNCNIGSTLNHMITIADNIAAVVENA